MMIGRCRFRQQEIDPDFAQYTGLRSILVLRQPFHDGVEELPFGFQDSFQCFLDHLAATETVYPYLAALCLLLEMLVNFG